ncbi:hypothetical protein C0Q70_14346 [Pomacea canaliculata]|uniref:Uncharacterized protein n=1 Tax=Pomacea canaliculata TaxID=400727 RepID=A0A2T7NZR8_POMCA|nr:hypothetical protein C0Q70_14346 [Pomacea canaliculata]
MDELAFRIDHMYAAPCSMTAASLQTCSVVSATTQQQNLSGICARSETENPKQENIQMSKDLKNAESSRKNSLCSGTEQRSGKLCPEKKGKGQISEPAPELKQISHGRAKALEDVADRDGESEESVKTFSVRNLDHQYHSLSDTVGRTHFQLAGNLSPVVLDNQEKCTDLNMHLSSGERVSLTIRNKAIFAENGGGCDNDKEDSVLNNESNETGNESDLNVSDRECEVTDKEQINKAKKMHSSTLMECHVTCYRHVAEGDNSELCEPVREIQQSKNAPDKAIEISSLADFQDKPSKDSSERKELDKDVVSEKETQGSTETQKKKSKTGYTFKNERAVVNPSKEKVGEDPTESDDLTKNETVTGFRGSEDIIDALEARQTTDSAKPEEFIESLNIVKDKDSLQSQRNAKEFSTPQKAMHLSEVLIDLSYTGEDMELSKAEKSYKSLKKGKRQKTSDDMDLIKDSTIESEGKKNTKMILLASPTKQENR